MRFSIRISSVMKPILFVAGATEENSYVELGDSGLHVKMGPWFDETLDAKDIAEVVASDWPWWGGLGVKTGPDKGGVGVVGSAEGVVAIRFKHPHPVKLWAVIIDVPVKCTELRVSLEEPTAFIAAVQSLTPN